MTAFCIGAATTYCALASYNIFRGHGAGRSRLNAMLGWVLLYMSMSNAKDLLLTYRRWHTEFMHDIVLVVDGWSAIAFAAILIQLTSPEWLNPRRMACMSLPFAAFTAAFVLMGSHAVVVAFSWFLGVFGLSVIIFGYVRAARYIEYIRSSYSNIDEINISWVRYVYVLVFFSQLLWLLASLIGEVATDCIYYLTEIAVWHLIVVHCRYLKQVGVEKDCAGEPLINGKAHVFSAGLDQLAADGELYQNPNLTLTDLAYKLKTNRTYLSNYFANVLHTSFYDYVNSRRVERSVAMMSEHPEYTLEHISQLSGFNSVSTFRRAFRKFKGHNPSKFKV